MAVKHATTKAAREKVFALADWNAGHTIDGNTGELLFQEAGGGIGTDANLFWDNTNKKLGLRTASPATTLDILTPVSVGTYPFRISSGGTKWDFGAGGVGGLPANHFGIGDGIAWRFVIQNTSGNVGVNTPSPNELVHAKKDQAAITMSKVENANTAGSSVFSAITTAGDAVIQMGAYGTTHAAYGAINPNEGWIYGTKSLTMMADNASGVIKFATGGSSEKVRIDNAGNFSVGSTLPQGKLHVGDQATNFLKVLADGEVNLVGTARVVNHVVTHAEAFKLIGLKPAVINSEGIFITLDFVHTAEKEAYASNFIPYRWDSDTDVEIGIDWFCDADGTGGDVVWGIEYLARKDNEQIAGATTTITQAFTGAGAGLMQRSHFTTKLLKANLEADDIIGIRIYRDHDAGGDTLDETARFLALHLHFIRNKLGEET